MSLKIISGRAGTGKTEKILRSAALCPGPSFIIVPEQDSFSAEQRMSSLMGVQGLGGAEVISFKRLAARTLGALPGAAKKRVDGATKTMLVSKILSDEKRKISVLQGERYGNALEISKIVSELKRYGLSADDLTEASEKAENLKLKAKLAELALVYRKYEESLGDEFADAEDDVLRLTNAVKTTDIFKDTEIFVCRFDSLTPAETACVAAFCERAKQVTVSVRSGGSGNEFLSAEKTKNAIIKAAHEGGAVIEKEEKLTENFRHMSGTELSHLERQYFAYPAEKFEGTCEAIKICAAREAYDEVHRAAKEIVSLLRDKKYRAGDIAVVSRAPQNYEIYVRSVFPLYGINFFSDSAESILKHPISLFIMSALEVVCENYSFETVFRYAKSGFLRIKKEDIDFLENYVLATGIRGSIWKSEEPWRLRAGIYTESAEQSETEAATSERADSIRRRIAEPLAALEQSLSEGKTAAEKCAAVYDYLERVKMPRRIRAMMRLYNIKNRTDEADLCKKIYDCFMDALSAVYNTFGDSKIGVRRFCDIFSEGLAGYESLSVPTTCDSVFVGDVLRMRGYKIKALIILGVNEGVFPARHEGRGFFADSDRAALADIGMEIAPTAAGHCMEEESLIYKCISMPEERLYLSYAVSGISGEAMRPSVIVSRIRDIFPEISVEEHTLRSGFALPETPDAVLDILSGAYHSSDEQMRRLYGWCLENPEYREKAEKILGAAEYKNEAERLSRENCERLFGENGRVSISKLEKFAACPFAYFMNYTLNARERQEAKLNVLDKGSFLHSFIDEFSRRIKNEGMSWHMVTDEYIETETDRITELFMPKLNRYLLESSKKTEHVFISLKRTVKNAIKRIADNIKSGDFEVLGSELSFAEDGELKPLVLTLQNGKKIRLEGKIDRIDICEEESGTRITVTDYKTSGKTLDFTQVFYGLNLQLIVYMTALCENENKEICGPVKPAAMLYCKLTEEVVPVLPTDGPEEIKAAKEKAQRLKGQIIGEETIEFLDKKAKECSRFLPVKYKKDGTLSDLSSVISPVQYENLSRHVKALASRLADSIVSGETAILPYRMANTTPCTYCDFKAACNRDAEIPGCGYRTLDSIDRDEFLNSGGGEDDRD